LDLVPASGLNHSLTGAAQSPIHRILRIAAPGVSGGLDIESTPRLEGEPVMSAISSTQSRNQISPADERVYHQSTLLGDWKGVWAKGNQPVEFKVVNIRGTTAQVEYTHNGHTERGIATVNGGTITFGSVTIASRDGKTAGMEFSLGTAKQTAVLAKAVAPATDQSPLVGSWGGSNTDGQSASVRILSVSGRDAQVVYTVNGYTQQGVGTVYKNTVMFGTAQISSDDGSHGTVVFPVARQAVSVDVTKYPTVNTVA
jgi:hypothetical protein